MVWSIARNLQLDQLGPRARRIVIFLALVISIAGAMKAAFALRFDFALPPHEAKHLLAGLAMALPIKLAIFHAYRLHRGWWTSFGLHDFGKLFSANVVASVATGLAIFIQVGRAFPRSVYILDCVLTLA